MGTRFKTGSRWRLRNRSFAERRRCEACVVWLARLRVHLPVAVLAIALLGNTRDPPVACWHFCVVAEEGA